MLRLSSMGKVWYRGRHSSRWLPVLADFVPALSSPRNCKRVIAILPPRVHGSGAIYFADPASPELCLFTAALYPTTPVPKRARTFSRLTSQASADPPRVGRGAGPRCSPSASHSTAPPNLALRD
jgi:hypothetical protein